MEIKVRQEGEVVVLDLSGSIDVNSANMVEITGQCLHDGYSDILCNFEEVDSIDYMGISVIVIAYKEVANSGGRMKFVNVAIHLRNLFSIAGLDKVIEMYASEEIALKSFQEDRAIENIKKKQLRRRFKRLPMDIKVELKDKYESSPTCLKVDILDISAIGAYIFGCGKFKLQDKVVVKFKLPPRQEEIELDAKVVWLSDKQLAPHIHPGMGVEFYNISAPVQGKLVEFIERNISTLQSDE